MRYSLYKKNHFENFGNRAFCQRAAVMFANVYISLLYLSRHTIHGVVSAETIVSVLKFPT